MVRANIKQAAQLLNMSVDTVRRRLKNGALSGERDGRGRWFVEIDYPGPQVHPAAGDEQFVMGTATPLQTQGGLSDELIDSLNVQIDDLRARLEASEAERRRDKEVAEADRQRLLTMIEKLIAKEIGPDPDSKSSNDRLAENAPSTSFPGY